MTDPINDAVPDGRKIGRELACKNSHNHPALAFQHLVYLAVSFHVPRNLRDPPLSARWKLLLVALQTTLFPPNSVPKVAINKDGDSGSDKNQVRASSEAAVVDSEAEPFGMKIPT
jgi:hypothetical protein